MGPSDWDDVSCFTMERQWEPEKEKEVINNMENMDINATGYFTTEDKEKEGRKGNMGGRGEPQVRAPSPPTMPLLLLNPQRRERTKRRRTRERTLKKDWNA